MTSTTKINNVMVAIICENFYPLVGYEGVPESHRDRRIPSVYMVMRWDGTLGFFGGRVDPGETIEQAAVREVFEEANLDIDPEALVHISTTGNDRVDNHLFGYVVTAAKFEAIAREAPLAEHYWSECQGILPIKLAKTGERACFTKILEQKHVDNSWERLQEVFDKYGVEYHKE